VEKNPSSHQDQNNDKKHQVTLQKPELLGMVKHSNDVGHTAIGQNTALPSSHFASNTALKKVIFFSYLSYFLFITSFAIDSLLDFLLESDCPLYLQVTCITRPCSSA
jgi:hypothetical protein